MSVLEGSTIIKGVSYVFWMKDTSEYSAEDRVYGVVHKGTPKFGHQDFSLVAQKSGKFFWSKKVDEEATDCTWKECVEALQFFKAPSGTPLTLTDKAYTFAEVATLCYEQKIFTSPEGMKYLAKKLKIKPSGDNDDTTDTNIILKAKEISDKLNNVKKNDKSVVPNSPLIPDSSIPVVKEVITGEGNMETEEVIDIEGEGEEIENLKEATAQAESKYNALMEENINHLAKIKNLEAKLQSSLQEQQKYMVAGDTANKSLASMNDDTATTVAKQLESKLSLISGIDNNMSDMVTKVTEIRDATTQLPNVIKALKNLPAVVYSEVRKLVEHHYVVIEDKLDYIESKADTSNASLNEGLLNVQDTLAAFGIEEGEEDEKTVDIPACIQSLVAAAEMSDKEASSKPTGAPSKGCYYEEHRLIPTFVCKCGCGGEIQLAVPAAAPPTPDGSHGGPSQGGIPQFLAHGNPQPQQVTQAAGQVSHGVAFQPGKQYTPRNIVESLPPYGGQMYHTTLSGHQVTPPTSLSTPETLEDKSVISRKMKKQLKDQEFKARKKLKLGSVDSPDQARVNNPQTNRPQQQPSQHETPNHFFQPIVTTGQWGNAPYYGPRYAAPGVRPQYSPTVTFRPGGNISPWLKNRFPAPPQ